MSRVTRYGWITFVLFAAILVLAGATDLASATTSTARENAINELFIGFLSGAVAIVWLRRGERWAWYTMSLWPLYILAQTWRAWSTGQSSEASIAVVFFVISLVGLWLTYPRIGSPVDRGPGN